MRHSALVRVTHWLTTASFVALAVSGVAILLAHPRLYWGETGAVGTPSLIDLPLPFIRLASQLGSGLTGVLYVLGGIRTRHFKQDLFSPKQPAKYNGTQRITYGVVVFVLFPIVI